MTIKTKFIRLMMKLLPSPAASQHNLQEQILESMARTLPPKHLRFEVHLAEHCNLNCRSCDHFSPLAEPEFVDFDKLKKDFERLSFLFDGECQSINLCGGEPLLNPQVPQILQMARSCFPMGEINLVSNGILILSQPDSFWQAMHDNKIILKLTKYPVRLDYEKMLKKANEMSVQTGFMGNSDKTIKTLWKLPIDPSGSQNYRLNFLKCFKIGICPFLYDGKIYPCAQVACIRHFNLRFNQNIPVSKLDFIDIYNARSADEIAAFLARPTPFCRFCNFTGIQNNQRWGISSKKIEEWV